jgi:hypothetical protein
MPGKSVAPSWIASCTDETLPPRCEETASPSAPLSPGPAAAATVEAYEPARLSFSSYEFLFAVSLLFTEFESKWVAFSHVIRLDLRAICPLRIIFVLSVWFSVP